MEYVDLLGQTVRTPYRAAQWAGKQATRLRSALKEVQDGLAEASRNNINPFTGNPLVRKDPKLGQSFVNWVTDFHGRSPSGHLAHTPKALKTFYKAAFGSKLGLGIIGATALMSEGNFFANVGRTAFDTGAFTVGGATGAAIGGTILPVVGAPVGYLVGGITATVTPDIIAGAMSATARYGVRQRNAYRNGPMYVDTQAAYTMRQRSSNIMRDNLMLHRRVMGQEAKYYHS